MLKNTHAFPTHPDVRNQDDGMTLRDYFAAKAMQSLMTTASRRPMKSIAKAAYTMADMMIYIKDHDDSDS
jgi:hypothetical protein